MKYSENNKLREVVCKDVANGMKINDVVKKYNISVYYAKKWSGEVYRKMDLETFVKKRYCFLTSDVRIQLESALADAMTEEEAEVLSGKTWDAWDSIIRNYLYYYAQEILKKN
jgi:transposase